MVNKDGNNFILSAEPDKVIFAELKNNGACKNYTNCISGTFQWAGNLCGILISNGKVLNNASAHAWLGRPDSCLICYKNNTITVKRLTNIPKTELPNVRWAISGVGLLDMYAPEKEGYCKFTQNGKNYDYSDVLRRTNHTAIGVKGGKVYGLYLHNMTGKEVSDYCREIGLEHAIMLDGGHIAAVHCSAGSVNASQKQSNIIQFVMDEEKPCKTVWLDAGHGGSDPGAVGAFSKEKDITLKVTKLVAAVLESHGVSVEMTREDDSFVNVEQRAKQANKAKVDCFVSIHCNSVKDSSKGGTETYAYKKTSKGYQLAETIHKHLISATGLGDRGVKTAGYVVLNQTTMPAALAEMAFISNKKEELLLNDGEWQQKVAEAIAHGIADYLGVKWMDEPEPEYNLKVVDGTGKETLYQIEWENRNGTVWAPVRQLAEAMGCKVQFDSENNRVVIKR